MPAPNETPKSFNPSYSAPNPAIFSKVQEKELVIVTIKKVQPYGFFASLDEFENVDAFCHISEVSSGWVKNVRDFVKEGQKTVAMVLRVDKEKRQIDLSLKRASDMDKKRKLEQYNLDKRAGKLLERAALKIKAQNEIKDVTAILISAYGDLWTVFQDAYEEKKLPEKLSAAWKGAITEIAKVEIKEKVIYLRAELKLKCYSPNGVETIKKLLTDISDYGTKTVKVEVSYIGAPIYYVDLTSNDFKTADKLLTKIEKYIEDNAKKLDIESTITRLKK